MKLKNLCEKVISVGRKQQRAYCTAVIVAAGTASRMQGIDKITAELDGKPMICRTVARFSGSEWIDEIIVVTRADLLERVAELVAGYEKVRMVVPGGETRVESVMAGVQAASEKTKLIAVHDGARPLVSEEVIARTAAVASKFHAAAPAVAVKDTVKTQENGAVKETLDRSTLAAVQTPQIFDRDLLAAALQNALEQKLFITDDCSAVEQLGMKVMLTKGEEENIKITTPLDLELAAWILNRRKTT